MARESGNVYDAAGRLLAGFDYDKQAWAEKGTWVRCGHSTPCACFGRINEGMPTPTPEPETCAECGDALHTLDYDGLCSECSDIPHCERCGALMTREITGNGETGYYCSSGRRCD